MELNQNLTNNANARLGSLALQRQVVKVVYDGANRLLITTEFLAFGDLQLALFHPVIEQLLCRTLFDFIRACTVQALHKQVAIEQREYSVVQHSGRHLEARIRFIQLLECERDNRDMAQTRSLQRLANEADVVGCATAATCLGNDHSKFIGVITARCNRFHDLASNQDGRVANIVVHILQTSIHRSMVNRWQQFKVISI